LYFDGSWHNNKDAKEALEETGAAQIFSKEHLEELINSVDKAKKMAGDGFKAVEAYRKKVLLGMEGFAMQIIGARYLLREKYFSREQESIRNQSGIWTQKFRKILFKCL